MSTITPMAEIASRSSEISNTSRLKLENLRTESGDGAQFRTALERHMNAVSGTAGASVGGNNASLGEKMMARATNLASEVKHDQQYVSKLLEQATRSADSTHLMKAMLALNDYQVRVQFISKTASKAASSVDQLTKLQ